MNMWYERKNFFFFFTESDQLWSVKHLHTFRAEYEQVMREYFLSLLQMVFPSEQIFVTSEW